MVNNGEPKLNPDYTLDNTHILCKKCKVYYEPDKKDISRKNPNVYYKTCQRCRDYQFKHNIINRYKNKN